MNKTAFSKINSVSVLQKKTFVTKPASINAHFVRMQQVIINVPWYILGRQVSLPMVWAMSSVMLSYDEIMQFE